jgi:hypothetical protein
MASEDLLMTDFVVLPDLIRTHATESPAIPHSSSATRLAGSIFDARDSDEFLEALAWLARPL